MIRIMLLLMIFRSPAALKNNALIDVLIQFGILRLPKCRDGGTGRRAGLKIRWWRHRVGSTPTLGIFFSW